MTRFVYACRFWDHFFAFRRESGVVLQEFHEGIGCHDFGVLSALEYDCDCPTCGVEYNMEALPRVVHAFLHCEVLAVIGFDVPWAAGDIVDVAESFKGGSYDVLVATR